MKGIQFSKEELTGAAICLWSMIDVDVHALTYLVRSSWMHFIMFSRGLIPPLWFFTRFVLSVLLLFSFLFLFVCILILVESIFGFFYKHNLQLHAARRPKLQHCAVVEPNPHTRIHTENKWSSLLTCCMIHLPLTWPGLFSLLPVVSSFAF